MNDSSILRSFGDLEHERLGRKSGALEPAGDGRGEIVLVQLSDRHVDRDIERALSAEREIPLADLRARLELLPRQRVLQLVAQLQPLERAIVHRALKRMHGVVVVVDNTSADATGELAERYGAERLRLERRHGSRPARSRPAASARASVPHRR